MVDFLDFFSNLPFLSGSNSGSPSIMGLGTGALGTGMGLYGLVANYLKNRQIEALVKDPYKFYEPASVQLRNQTARDVTSTAAQSGTASGNYLTQMITNAMTQLEQQRQQQALQAAGVAQGALGQIPAASAAGLMALPQYMNTLRLARESQNQDTTGATVPSFLQGYSGAPGIPGTNFNSEGSLPSQFPTDFNFQSPGMPNPIQSETTGY